MPYNVHVNRWRGTYYPTGEPKPVLRGYFHLLGFYMIPITYFLLQIPHCSSILSYIAAFANASAPLVLYRISSYFHMEPKTIQEHNKWRRIDHSAIFYYIFASNITPALLLIFRSQYIGWGIVMMVLNILGFIFGIIRNYYKELTDKTDIIHQIHLSFMVGLIGIFAYPLSSILSIYVWIPIILVWLNNAIGLLFFNRSDFYWIKDVLGNHEIFHISTILGEVISWTYKMAFCLHLNV